jgi:hypothetical protein
MCRRQGRRRRFYYLALALPINTHVASRTYTVALFELLDKENFGEVPS